MKKSKDVRLLVILIILLFIINYPFLDNFLKNLLTETETIPVDRIIDGDTIESNGTSIRLLGVNSPERGEFYYEEAKEFLESRILNETVILKFGKDRYDKYDRTLAYIFLDSKNINLELVEQGYANYYFPSGKDAYYDEFVDAWKICLDKNVNLCEKSGDVCAKCIELKNLDSKEQGVILYNNCSFSCNLNNWRIKNEGRKTFVFDSFVLEPNKEVNIIVGNGTDSSYILYWQEDSVWAETGDTIFLRDDNGKLVFWRSY